MDKKVLGAIGYPSLDALRTEGCNLRIHDTVSIVFFHYDGCSFATCVLVIPSLAIDKWSTFIEENGIVSSKAKVIDKDT